MLYIVAKQAVLGMTKTGAIEHGPQGDPHQRSVSWSCQDLILDHIKELAERHVSSFEHFGNPWGRLCLPDSNCRCYWFLEHNHVELHEWRLRDVRRLSFYGILDAQIRSDGRECGPERRELGISELHERAGHGFALPTIGTRLD